MIFIRVSFSFQYVLNPTYTNEQIEHLDKNEKMVRAYDGTLYLPGSFASFLFNA